MSAAARKMMEKMGWKEGEGLGKDKDGVKSYLKVVRRDPHTATGLGHMADPTQGGNLASTHAVELDGIYSTLVSKKRQRRDSEEVSDAPSSSSSSSSTASSSSTGQHEKSVQKREAVAKNKKAEKEESFSCSSSSSDSDNDDSEKRNKRGSGSHGVGDVTRISDAELFARCGGVRLGRAGRHRFFDGKLSRIASSHATVSGKASKADDSSSDSD